MSINIQKTIGIIVNAAFTPHRRQTPLVYIDLYPSQPCLYEKLPPVVSAALRCGSADQDAEQEPPVAVLLRSRRLEADIQESETSREQKEIQGKTTLELRLNMARASPLSFFSLRTAPPCCQG